MICYKCKKDKPEEEFNTKADKSLTKSCTECLARQSIYGKRYHATHGGHTSPLYLNSRLKHEYGIGLDRFTEMFEEQEGVCAVCGKECSTGRRLCVDHNHDTGRVRGLLCLNCNQGIGKLGDDPALLRAAADYLDRTNI